MAYSYTQLAHYLGCPQRYRYRYLDGWQERDSRASMLFGRAFETALTALFRKEDPAEALFRAWSPYQGQHLSFSHNDTWDRLLHDGIHLLEIFARQERVRIADTQRDLQVRLSRQLGNGEEFLAYVDAIGEIDGIRSIIDWKTTTACYPAEPDGLLALDPQLVCYSWITGISQVAFVVFVRKRLPEIQYLKATISDTQRQQFGELVEHTVEQIRSGPFLPHPGIRFPQNGCTSCSYVGLCLNRPEIVDRNLIRVAARGESLGWLDELQF